MAPGGWPIWSPSCLQRLAQPVRYRSDGSPRRYRPRRKQLLRDAGWVDSGEFDDYDQHYYRDWMHEMPLRWYIRRAVSRSTYITICRHRLAGCGSMPTGYGTPRSSTSMNVACGCSFSMVRTCCCTTPYTCS